jgi:mxaJ protein
MNGMRSSLLAIALLLAGALSADARDLRVCVDPNNLPYSNRAEEGFDNRIAALVARDLGANLIEVWRPHRGHGYFRRTLYAGVCDVLLGVPAGVREVATTRPYYRSSFVFVAQAARALRINSFDDPRLPSLKIGVPMFGEGYDTPPVAALGRRGIVQHLQPYEVEGDYSDPRWQARIVDAVARGEVDIAVAWGPPAGYFAPRQAVPLTISLTPAQDGPGLPLAFDIAFGVRRGDAALRDALGQALARNRTAIDAILAEFGVVRAEAASP